MADEFIKTLGLVPLPIGGLYAESMHAKTTVKPLDGSGREVRDAYSVIYLLLRGTDINAWHKMKSEETYFYHRGGHIVLHMITEEGKYENKIIGDPSKDLKARFHCHVPKNVWFALELQDKTSYCVFSEAAGPGFEYEDCEVGDRDNMLTLFPQHKEIVEKFCLK
ncbi:uncharacterized protein [Montipora foliosa]|uniref:uncharacterized protein n=1 Tax=Montipora foliosa TaxID=591990 RepID=UPI0035F10CC2